MSKWATVILIVCMMALAAGSAVIAGQRKDEVDALKKQLVVQNVQLTQKMREVKADAYRDGLITCGNEDIAYLNEQADYYQSLAGANPLSKLMRQWAQTWGYDDDTLNQMTEEYMDGGSY